MRRMSQFSVVSFLAPKFHTFSHLFQRRTFDTVLHFLSLFLSLGLSSFSFFFLYLITFMERRIAADIIVNNKTSIAFVKLKKRKQISHKSKYLLFIHSIGICIQQFFFCFVRKQFGRFGVGVIKLFCVRLTVENGLFVRACVCVLEFIRKSKRVSFRRLDVFIIIIVAAAVVRKTSGFYIGCKCE